MDPRSTSPQRLRPRASSILHFLPEGREPSSGIKCFFNIYWTSFGFLASLLSWANLLRSEKELPRSHLLTWDIDESRTQTGDCKCPQ